MAKKQEWVAVYVNQEKPNERRVISAFGNSKKEAIINAEISEGYYGIKYPFELMDIYTYSGNPSMEADSQMAKGAIVDSYSVATNTKIHPLEINEFISYCNEFYGKDGVYSQDLNGGEGFSANEIKQAVEKYLQELGSQKTWGDGDSLDRERVREILQPSYKMAKGGRTKRSISKDEISEIVAHVKGHKKYAHGGRLMSMEQQAAEAVGDDVWFSLEDREKSELVEELVRSGTITATGSSTDKRIMELIQQNDYSYMANGGVATAGKFKVKYYLKESPNEIKEKFFDDKDRADFFFETIQEDEDIVVMPMETVVEKVQEKPKSKSLFSSAKPVPATAAARKKMREQVQVNGIGDEIARYDQLKATINNAKAEQELIGGRLKEIGRDKFLEIYEQRGFRPANFDLADGSENILLEVTDKYLKVEPEKAAILEQYSGLLETKTTYEFNADILEKEVSNGMTVGDVVSMLIQDSKILSDSDKENLIKAKTTMRVPKGTIDRLMDYDNPREVFNLISPILALK